MCSLECSGFSENDSNISEVGHEYFCLLRFVCFVLIVDRHHIDYRTLGSQAAANLLGEVSNKSIKAATSRYSSYFDHPQNYL